jgi:hypothetical protein
MRVCDGWPTKQLAAQRSLETLRQMPVREEQQRMRKRCGAPSSRNAKAGSAAFESADFNEETFGEQGPMLRFPDCGDGSTSGSIRRTSFWSLHQVQP